MTAILNKTKSALSGLSKEELTQIICNELGWERFRAGQIHSWIYVKSSNDFAEWTDLSADKRQQIADKFEISLLKILNHQISKKDGTEKFLFQLPDGQTVESVLMCFEDRDSLTACISSQVGCAVGCPFCATGKLGLKRNLTAAEIVDQVMTMQRITGRKINNLVFMGQGEPLHNLPNLLEAIKIFRESVGIGVRHITVSTSGLVPQIIELGQTKLQINLAISLHTASQELREKLVPIAKRWNLFDLTKALKQHFEDTGRRITFEYTLLKGINDSPEQARALSDFVRDLPFPCLINLIPYNSTGGEYQRPDRGAVQTFKTLVERSGRKVTVRVTLGSDIDAACGQLANKFEAA
jgi:23S rRNA (adenine2503-C2)-methyltransferase